VAGSSRTRGSCITPGYRAGRERVSRASIPSGGGGPGRDRRRMGGSSPREVVAVSTAESAAAPVVPSYASGTSDVPLLGDTIGDNFDRVVAAQPDHEAMVDVPSGRRWTYAQMREDVDTVALGLLAAGLGKGDRVGIWAPNVAEWTLVQYATAKLGVILVNINPAYRTHELEYVLNQAGISAAGRGHELQDVRLRGDDQGGPAELPRAARGGAAGHARTGTRSSRRAGAATARSWPACRPSCRPTTRSTSSTRRAPRASPRAPRSRTTTSSTTATSSDGCAATAPTTASASPCPSTTASAW
jgi:hypothetical protein